MTQIQRVLSRLLPALGHRADERFNVFAVMRHGTHEKQLSNVFAWLLDPEGTHGLGDGFQRIFVDEASRGHADREALIAGAYSVRQEVNTSLPGEPEDIADLVLENHETRFVIENYYTSDGHGHSYEGYRQFGAQGRERSVVVMLCGAERRGALTEGWEGAQVVTYSTLLGRLMESITRDSEYQRTHPDQCVFFEHMHRRFVRGRDVNDDELVDFIDAMCTSGEAGRYGWQNREDAAISFGDHLREEAIRRFLDSRDVLVKVRNALRDYAVGVLVPEVNAALGVERVAPAVYANYRGSYEWTVAFYRADDPQTVLFQIKFGPSAWFANEGGAGSESWTTRVPRDVADYSRLFLTWMPDMSVHQSAVSVRDVLEGLRLDDNRLRDEIVQLTAPSALNSGQLAPH